MAVQAFFDSCSSFEIPELRSAEGVFSRQFVWRPVRATARGVIALAFLMLRPAPMGAQRFTCEGARTVLLSDAAARRDQFSAANTILGCGNVGAGTIASALRRATPNTTADTIASNLAFLTFDRRLADSIRVIALDSSQSTERRTLYLRLLANYVAPGTGIDVDAGKRGSSRVLHRSVHAAVETRSGPFGTWPMRAEDRASVLATIVVMGARDPDEKLRRLAERVGKELPGLLKHDAARDSVRNELFRRP